MIAETITRTVTTTTTSYVDFWTILSGLGTFVAAMIALFTLRKMDQQRKDSFKPKLIILPLRKSIHNYNKANEFDGSNITGENYAIIQFEIVNIGKGPAEDINIAYTTPTSRYIDYIKSNDLDNEFEFSTLPKDYQLSHSTTSKKIYFSIEETKVIDEDILVPMDAIPDSVIRFSVNRDLKAFTAICAYFGKKRSLLNAISEGIPKPMVTINFSDVAGNKYNTNYLLHTKISYAHINMTFKRY